MMLFLAAALPALWAPTVFDFPLRLFGGSSSVALRLVHDHIMRLVHEALASLYCPALFVSNRAPIPTGRSYRVALLSLATMCRLRPHRPVKLSGEVIMPRSSS